MRTTLIALSCLFFAAQTWGYHRHFRQIGRMTWRLRAMAGAFLLAFVAQCAALWPGRPLAPGAWLAVPIYGAGLLLWGWATRASGRQRLSLAFSRGDRPERLLSEGPFRLVRHPFYSSYLLYWIAGFVATLDWIVGATGMLAAGLCIAAARREERRFRAGALAGPYADYQARTGMFIPWIR